jgi:hypothetical protein
LLDTLPAPYDCASSAAFLASCLIDS